MTVQEDVGVDLCLGAGARLTINCVADRGNPVTITWTRNGGPLQPGETVVDGSLVVDVRAGGDATYQCVARNAAGSASSSTMIRVIGSEMA